MYMCMFVLNDPDRLDDILQAWNEAGLSGATILESTGSYRYRANLSKLHMRFLPEAHQLLSEEFNYTLFVLVPDREQVDRCLHAVEQIIGDLNDPDTGVFAAWPLEVIKGVPQSPSKEDRA